MNVIIERMNDDITSKVTPQPDPGEFDAVLRELCGPESTYSVQIHRWNDSRNRYAYVRRMPASEFTVDWIQQSYGGGKYNFRITDQGNRHVKSVVYCIEDTPHKPAGGNGSDPSEASTVRELLASLAKQQDQIIALLTRSSSSPAKDPIDTALKILEVLRPTVHPNAPASTFKEMMDVFREGIEMGAMQQGDSILPIVDKLGKPLLDLLQRQQEIDGSVKALPKHVRIDEGAPSRGADGGAPNVRTDVEPSPSGAPSLLDQIRVSIGQLIPLAKAGREPSVYSLVFLDQLSDALYKEIWEFSAREDFVTFALQTFPETKAHEAWFTEFLSALKEQLHVEEEDADVSTAD